MGSNQFQREYIEYLQKRNTELLNRLNHMKQSYENKILSKDLSKDYLISTLQDVLNIFTEIPQEIDLFFEKITAAMGVFKNILLRKSEMVHLVEEISKALSSNETFNTEIMPLDQSGSVENHFPKPKANKKVKVSPMINGHIISTEPRIFLSRVPGVLTPERRGETCQLSPIIEASPNTPDPSNLRSHIFREIKIPLERINLNKMSYNYISEESPKSRFKGPKIWKNSLSSNKHQSDSKRKSVFFDSKENLIKKLSLQEGELPQQPEDIDPQEGPSWLYEENTEIDASSSRFIDYRRRKHRFATVFDNDEDCLSYFEEKPKKSLNQGSEELYKNRKETDDEEEDVEEIKERISESSEDFICESFSSECGENYSQFKKRRRRSRRGLTRGTKDHCYTTKSDKDLKEETSVNEKKSVSDTLAYSDTSDEGENERNSMQRLMKNRKSSRKLGRMSAELPFEKAPRRSESGGRETRIITRSKDSNRESTSTKDTLDDEVFIDLENSAANENNLLKRLKTRRPSVKKKIKKRKSKIKSRSPRVSLRGNEGRVRRKAAPSFTLVEPKLNTKLRRGQTDFSTC